jgi:aminoglycoside phosphotransferase (APT) family kinase protein
MAKSPLILAALAKDAVRHVDFVQVKSLNAGTDGAFDTALLTATTGEHYVVRIANTQSAGVEQDVELQALRALGTAGRQALPFKITNLIGETKDDSGSRALIFDFVYGSPIDVNRVHAESELARSIGLAVASIHKLPLATVENAHLAEFEPEQILRARTAELDKIAATGKVSPILLSRWEAAIEDSTFFRFQPTVVHGALNGDTVLEEDGRQVAGVLAWSSLRISDPAEDLAWIMASEHDDFIDAVFAAYSASRGSADASLRQRATLYSELELGRWLLHGLNKGDQLIIDDAIGMLTTVAENVEAGLIGNLTAAPFVAPVIQESLEQSFAGIEPDDHLEVIEIKDEASAPVAADVAISIATDDEFETVSLLTAPIEIVELESDETELEVVELEVVELEADDSAAVVAQPVDDKTRPIELPEKTDNELF